MYIVKQVAILNWWKGKPSGSIACTRKQQPRFYWSCSSVVMNDATPLTPPSAWAELKTKSCSYRRALILCDSRCHNSLTCTNRSHQNYVKFILSLCNKNILIISVLCLRHMSCICVLKVLFSALYVCHGFFTLLWLREFPDLIRNYVNSLVTHIPCNIYTNWCKTETVHFIFWFNHILIYLYKMFFQWWYI